MPFIVRKGVPEILELWKRLLKGFKQGMLSGDERELFKKWAKAVAHYLENHTPAAGRLFWVYGPSQGEITIIGLEPHPENAKSRGYDRVSLSDLPPLNRHGEDPPPPKASRKERR